MTEDELREMERMWADGTSLKVMAHRMGYTMEHLGFVMRQDRARFPKRHKSFTQEERDQWADRYLSGELTARQVAERAGCSPVTVRNWARDRLSGRTAARRAECSVPIADAAAMWARGLTEREMADALGVTLACVKGVVRRHRDRFPYRYGREGA